MSSLRGYAPTVSVQRPGDDGLEQRARDLLVGHVVESVQITAGTIFITVAGGGCLSLEYTGGLSEKRLN